jgi:hypothetical protein
VRDTDNGTPTNSTYTAKYDGKKYPVTNAPWDTVAIKQVDENRFTKQDDEGRWKVLLQATRRRSQKTPLRP